MKNQTCRLLALSFACLTTLALEPNIYAQTIENNNKPQVFGCEATDSSCLILKEGEASPGLETLGKFEFVKVLEDSRCPIDAFCVWAGRVAVELKHTSGIDGRIQKFVIGLGAGLDDKWLDDSTGDLLKLEAVWPQISLEEPIDGPYQLKLHIEKKPSDLEIDNEELDDNATIPANSAESPCQKPLS